MIADIKPCPFCGAPGFLMLAGYGFKIKCTDTDCTVETPIKTHNHQVIDLWNRRATPTQATQPAQDALDARRYRWLRDVGDDSWAAMGARVKEGAKGIDAAIDAAMQQGQSK